MPAPPRPLSVCRPRDRPPVGLVSSRRKLWPKALRGDLTVGFLQKTALDVQAKTVAFANAWARVCGVRFRLVPYGAPALLRIDRSKGVGFSSLVGTDARYQQTGPTMWLEINAFNVDAAGPDITHEFGHALGFEHAHLHPDIIGLLIRPKVEARYLSYGWSLADIDGQIFTPGRFAVLSPADRFSILSYVFSPEETTDGLGVPGGTKLSPLDAAMAAAVYPKGK